MGSVLFFIVISILPFLYLFTQIQVVGNFTYAFANIAGFIGATLLLWEFVLGIKDIAKKIAPNPADFMKLHIILGVWGMFFVLVHPILEMFSYFESVAFLFFPDISTVSSVHITYGRIALLFVLMVWLSSTFLRNNISYKKWITTHMLSYPMMFFVFIHALEIGSFLITFTAIKVYWFFLMIVYACLVIWRVILFFRQININFTPLNNEYKKK